MRPAARGGWTAALALLAELSCAAAAGAQQARFDDVVRNLRNPDAKVRLEAVRLLRESRYPEAAGPVAALVTDPVDAVQLEAIAAERAFFLAREVPGKRRVALFVEVRDSAPAATAFALGPLAVWAHPVPPELVRALIAAVDDDSRKVRLEAIYTLGTIARPPLAEADAAGLTKALDHYDPDVRAAAARVIGRLRVTSAGDALVTAVNDSEPAVRFAAMRALGEIRMERAVEALTAQFTFYGRGEGAAAALDALARIASPSSVPLFKERLADRDPRLRQAAAEGLGRAGDTSEIPALQIGAGNDGSPAVRAAMAFALQKLGQHYLPRLVEFMTSARLAPQVAGYLVELGPGLVPDLLTHLQDPSPSIRGGVARVIGLTGESHEIGEPAAVRALTLLASDPDPDVQQAASQALQRLKARTP